MICGIPEHMSRVSKLCLRYVRVSLNNNCCCMFIYYLIIYLFHFSYFHTMCPLYGIQLLRSMSFFAHPFCSSSPPSLLQGCDQDVLQETAEKEDGVVRKIKTRAVPSAPLLYFINLAFLLSRKGRRFINGGEKETGQKMGLACLNLA